MIAKPVTVEIYRADPLGSEWIESSQKRSKRSAKCRREWMELSA
jgi:hypothetical protein